MFQRVFMCFFFLNVAYLSAQQPAQTNSFKFNDIKNVLEDQWISNIIQDREGFIWAATQDGLYKYNGKNFKSYRYNLQEKNSLPGNWVRAIEQDAEGAFWIGTYGSGLVQFNPKKNVFEKVLVNANSNPQIIYSIFISTSSTIWVVSDDGLYYKSKSKSNFVKLTASGISTKILEIDNGTEIFSFKKTLYAYDALQERLDPLLHNITIGKMESIGNNQIIYISENKLYLYDFISSPIKIDLPNEDVALFMSNVKNDACIIVGKKGNYVFHTNTNSFQPYNHNLDKFKDLGISTLFIDRQNQLWIGTHKGLFKESVLSKVFSSHFKAHARRIIVDSTLMYIGGNDGFWEVSKANHANYRHFLNDVDITAMCKTDAGFWFGDLKGNVYFLNTSNQVKTIYLNNQKSKISKIFGIVEDLNGFLWISTWQGIYVLDELGNTVNRYQLDENKEIKILKTRIDSKDNLWMITVGDGVYKIPNISKVDKNDKHITYQKYLHNKANFNSINSDIVMDIHTSANGMVWIGSDFGVNMYHEENDHFVPLQVNGEIFDKKIMAIETDVKNLVWISTINSGIYVFNKENNTLFNLKEEDGLLSNACLYTSSTIYKEELYFGTDEGVQIINTANFTYPTVNKAPAFSEMYVQGESAKTILDIASLTDPIELRYNQNSFHIDLEIADNRFPEKIDYYYKLGETTNFWTKIEGNTIHFNNLNYGEYNLLVKAAYQATDPAPINTLALKIKPPWHKSILAYILLFLGLSGTVFYFFQLRYKQKLASNKLKAVEELDHLKSSLFTNISHELRTPLTLISGPIENQLSKVHLKPADRETLQMVKQNADRLLNLVNQLTDLSLIDAGQIKLKIERGNLEIILKQLVAAFQFMANENEINIHSSITGLEDCWFDKDLMEKIASNLLSNAIKYAPKKSTVYFTAQRQIEHLQLSVMNKNNSIKADKLGKIFQRFYQHNEASEGIGVGLALVKDLVNLSKGTILANTLEEDKIQFSVTLPINKDAFTALERIEPTKKVIATAPSKTPKKEQRTIVVIEDEEDILNFVASLLKDDYNIIKFTASKDAIVYIKKELPDLVISDVMMPEPDGITLCSLLKKDTLTSHIPIILLTAKVTQRQQLEGLETGADAYLTKPFHADILKVRVRKLMEIRTTLKERFMEQPILTKALEVTTVEAEFMQRLKDVLDAHLVNPDFTSDAFSKYMLMSRTQLHRKLKAIVGMTTSEFIRSQRMLLARDLLKKQDIGISEVVYLVGFNSVSYFIKCFKKSYKETPSQFVAKYKS